MTTTNLKNRDYGIINNYLSQNDWRVNENSNMGFSLQGLNVHISSDMMAHYWLSEIYTDEIRESHIGGDFHLHDLGLLATYSYFGDECVLVELDDKKYYASFKQLYDMIKQEESLYNERDGAYIKYPQNLKVWDNTGFTSVKRVIRKSKTNPFVFIKSTNGFSQIVTDNHPVITNNGEKEASSVIVSEDSIFTYVPDKNMMPDTISTLYIAEEFLKLGLSGYRINGEEVSIYNCRDEGLVGRNGSTNAMNNRLDLNFEFGWIYGILLAEGSFAKKGAIGFGNIDEDIIKRFQEYLNKYYISYRIWRKGKGAGISLNSVILRDVFHYIFHTQNNASLKKMPVEFLNYNVEFLKGIVAGMIDGDGTGSDQVVIRIVSRTLLNQMSFLLRFLGYIVREWSPQFSSSKGFKSNFWLFGISFTPRFGEVAIDSIKTSRSTKNYTHEQRKSNWKFANSRYTFESDGEVKVSNAVPFDIEYETEVYDITTETGTFICNGILSHNCEGWDLKDLLTRGFRGVEGKIASSPPKHLSSALGQIVNFFFTLQGESAGAQAMSNFDTLLSPYVKVDNLEYPEIKQLMQEFIFNLNVPTRVGFQSPFSNLSFDLFVPSFLRSEYSIVDGKPADFTYGECQKEMDLINKAFCEVMCEGDSDGRIFTFPIPTYNITKEFDPENPNLESMWKMTAKFGLPYFSNFINSDLDPEDVRSMCCRLRLNHSEIRKRGGGLFGSNPLTGSIGVVTVNLSRVSYLSENEDEFFVRLSRVMDIAKDSLEIKRKKLDELTDQGLFPYSSYYLQDIKLRFGSYWANHFSTIGVIGMNEACLNMYGFDITFDKSKKFAEDTLKFIQNKLLDYQKETGNLYNLEATPAEGCSYRLAKMDKAEFPDIITAGTEEAPSYSNSTQLPVNCNLDLFESLNHQDELQTLYTGGTVFHCFLGEAVDNPEVIKRLVMKIANGYRMPYFTITPTFSICNSHGYLKGRQDQCSICGERTEVYSRIVGYFRPVKQWNKGKKREFEERSVFSAEIADKQMVMIL